MAVCSVPNQWVARNGPVPLPSPWVDVPVVCASPCLLNLSLDARTPQSMAKESGQKKKRPASSSEGQGNSKPVVAVKLKKRPRDQVRYAGVGIAYVEAGHAQAAVSVCLQAVEEAAKPTAPTPVDDMNAAAAEGSDAPAAAEGSDAPAKKKRKSVTNREKKEAQRARLEEEAVRRQAARRQAGPLSKRGLLALTGMPICWLLTSQKKRLQLSRDQALQYLQEWEKQVGGWGKFGGASCPPLSSLETAAAYVCGWL